MEIRINVMMFGGRRCGKTSIITAMQNCFENVFGEENELAITPSDFNTMTAIDEKSNEIRSFFHNRLVGDFSTDGRFFTDDGTSYEFNIYIHGKSRLDKNNKPTRDKIMLSLFDYPGEWLNRKDKYEEVLIPQMNGCDIIMIAIDTPYLMEPVDRPDADAIGEFNNQRNYCYRIANMIKAEFMPAGFPKVILFVPLKCEKYYNRGQMPLVNAKIKAAYQELLHFADGPNRGMYEAVIAPILTFGPETVEFSRFDRDPESGEYIMDANHKMPVKPLYRFVDMESRYSPLYCEQPLLYALTYLLVRMSGAKQAEKKKNIFQFLKNSFGETFLNWASAEDFLAQEKHIRSRLKTGGDGYELIFDPLGLGKNGDEA